MQEDDEVYELWDKEKLPCHCDPSYFGADCLQRTAPWTWTKYLQGKDKSSPRGSPSPFTTKRARRPWRSFRPCDDYPRMARTRRPPGQSSAEATTSAAGS